MAMRGGPARRLTGNPLGGMLRDLGRQTRRTTRRAGIRPAPPGTPGEETGLPPGVPAPAGAPPWPVAAVLMTDEDSRARWVFPEPFTRPPVLTALPVDPDHGDERTLTVALEDVGTWYATVRVWRTRPRRGHGVTAPAGPDVLVHVTALDPDGRGR